jgi:hypothetical protein
MLQWGIREMSRKVFRFCYSVFASISFRTGIWYADSNRHELVLRKLCANRQRTLGARGCSRRTKFDVGNLQDDGALFWRRPILAPYFFIARLKNAQLDKSFPQVPLRFISDGIPHSWRERWADRDGHRFGQSFAGPTNEKFNIEPAEQETIVSRVVTPDAQSEINVEAVDDITTTGPAARRIPAAIGLLTTIGRSSLTRSRQALRPLDPETMRSPFDRYGLGAPRAGVMLTCGSHSSSRSLLLVMVGTIVDRLGVGSDLPVPPERLAHLFRGSDRRKP